MDKFDLMMKDSSQASRYGLPCREVSTHHLLDLGQGPLVMLTGLVYERETPRLRLSVQRCKVSDTHEFTAALAFVDIPQSPVSYT
jgi:hypothetical protein